MKKLTTVLIIGSLVSGCASLSSEENQWLGSGLGGALGGLIGSKVDSRIGGGGIVTTLAAGAGALIGGKIAKYLTERDKQNIVTVLNDTQNTQPAAWCSDSKNVSRNVKSVQCGNANKIIETPGVVAKNNQGETCRSSKTEVAMPNGQIETVTQNLCLAKDGGWYEKTA